MVVTVGHNAVSGVERRFDSFFADRYHPMVGLATTMVDHRSTAEEIVQEAFQRVWMRWESLTQPTCYLRTAVVNCCHDELRRRRVRRDANPVLRRCAAEAERHYLADVLADMKPQRRQAVVLRFYGGHTVSEVAEAMKIPVGTAKSLIHRGLADMRGVLV